MDPSKPHDARERGRIIPIAPARGCSRAGGRAGCGATEDAARLPAATRERIREHPCYSEQAHHHFARMHVAVAPACNVQCHYCNRKYDCAAESRPGVTSERLAPEQALRRVLAVAARLPQLSVVGIAGPGDALANPGATFRTLALVREAAPDLKLCLSTNGLALPDHAERLAAAGVDHVTVTINAIDPHVAAGIYPWVFFRHRRHHGLAAARILIERQVQGLERLVALGVLVKVNSVMIPGVNDAHLPDVHRAVMARGAFLHNVMPLISDPAHGTHYGLTGQRAPTGEELAALQDRCEGGARLMRHCRQCRADAVGLLGEDLAQDAWQHDDPPPAYDTNARAAYRRFVERERADRDAAESRSLAGLAALDLPAARVAVATRGGGRINQHFGHATELLVYEVSPGGIRLLGVRKVERYCAGGAEDEEAMPSLLRALADCRAVLVAKIGTCPRRSLAAAGIEASDAYAHQYIEASLAEWYRARAAVPARAAGAPAA